MDYKEIELNKDFTDLFRLIDYVEFTMSIGLIKIERGCVKISHELWNIWDEKSRNIFAHNLQVYYYALTNFDETVLKIFCMENGNELGFILKEVNGRVKFIPEMLQLKQ